MNDAVNPRFFLAGNFFQIYFFFFSLSKSLEFLLLKKTYSLKITFRFFLKTVVKLFERQY